MALDLFDLTGKVAMVTGASKGLGKAMSVGLAKAGADLALCARNPGDLRNAASEIATCGTRVETFPMDVLRGQSIREAVDAILARFGRIDILVNNAGVNVRKTTLELSEEEWDRVLDTNLKGYFLVAQAVAPAMIRQGGGKIINLSSIFGAVGMNNQAAYASSKGGIVQLTKVMAIEWARSNIQVNAIGPTYFETPLVATLRNDPERFRFINERTPMGRWGQPEELEGTVIFLAARASDFITGQTVYVDGGWTIW
ncbi:MAG: 2-deoxy-D-gluconate 3-dehydrogenase [Deltaproteobacteria bacterium]|nr:MAG: 2-deoxy-D-gluconate 3-dehydrogenase [Deltaproteobacteria bacterium]